jgi:hypothetical protein
VELPSGAAGPDQEKDDEPERQNIADSQTACKERHNCS